MKRIMKRKSVFALVLCLSLGLAAMAAAETASKDGIEIKFHGSIAPVKLPRHTLAPVGVQMGAKIRSTTGERPSRLAKIILDINAHGVIDSKGLALCKLSQLHNSSAARARRVCGDAEVGHGNVTSRVGLPGQGQFSTNGPLLAFNGRYKGKHAIFAHVTSKGKLAITYVIIFVIKKAHGTYGTSLVAKVPSIASGSGYISAFDLSLKRRFHVHGQRRSYVSASCPLPNEVNIGEFKFARSTYVFDDGTTITSALERSCKARG
jgi:hypothetical protein